jgi:hypothetical protein
MLNAGFDDMFFTAQYVNDLRDEIKSVVQTQLLDSVTKASMLARIQQQVWERTKFIPQKGVSSKFTANSAKADSTSPTPATPLWKERQLRDYRRANNLCYFCGDKFDANHL